MLSLPSDMSLRSGGLHSPDLQNQNHNIYIPRQAKIVAVYKAETTGYQDFEKTWAEAQGWNFVESNQTEIKSVDCILCFYT